MSDNQKTSEFLDKADRQQAVAAAFTAELEAKFKAGTMPGWEMRNYLERLNSGEPIATQRAEKAYAKSLEATKNADAKNDNAGELLTAPSEIKTANATEAAAESVNEDRTAAVSAESPKIHHDLPSDRLGISDDRYERDGSHHYDELKVEHANPTPSNRTDDQEKLTREEAEKRTLAFIESMSPASKEMFEKSTERLMRDTGRELVQHHHDAGQGRGGHGMGES